MKMKTNTAQHIKVKSENLKVKNLRYQPFGWSPICKSNSNFSLFTFHFSLPRTLLLLVFSFSLFTSYAQTYESFIEQGLAAANEKHYDEAIGYFRQALKSSPDDIRNALTYANIAHIQ